MSDTYSEVEDLIIGDLRTGATVDKAAYVQSAADEMNGRIGFVYELPIEESAVTEAAWLVLKKINNFLASGRLIMAVAVGGEDTALQAYGLSLVQEAFNELAMVLDGTLPLDGATRTETTAANSPVAANTDSASAIDAFEATFFEDLPRGSESSRGGDDTAIWRPGV